MTPKYTLYIGTFVHLPREKTGERHELAIHRGALWVSAADGRIKGFDWSISNDGDLQDLIERHGWATEGSNWAGGRPRVKVVRAREENNEFFFPGFIDTHIHAPQYPNAGLFGILTLLDWLKKYTFPVEKSFHDTRQAHTVYNRIITRTLANGTTCASYFATIHVPATNILATLCKQRGQRALIGRVCMDRVETTPPDYRDPSPQESISLNYDVINHVKTIDPHGTYVKPIITPRFALACTEPAMRGLAALAQEYKPPLHIQTHISENKNEVCEVECMYKMKYAEVYEHFGLLTPRTILAHAVHLSEQERRIISGHRSKISHCPASNSALGSGLCPVRYLLDDDITVGLGTDVSGGYDASILENVREACLVSRLYRHTDPEIDDKEARRIMLSVADALYLATRGGAAVVDMADEIGGFDRDMSWDAQLISLGPTVEKRPKRWTDDSPVDIFEKEEKNWPEKIEKWVWNGDDRNVSAVWVHGKLVHRRGDEHGKCCRHGWKWVWGAGLAGVGALFVLRRMRS
ncbi:hypothetical protein EYZ11_010897 [Aspergillus tanneri]|uniref:Probable guanine deaminase n=1 Tax=Aspergillus tanneri TaxID=1220188 RepID=A0A4S3J4S2_9EURO|nr:uncharacterized protein ATNIH1004_002806 [Aspergillus tanneri]KAA8650125.1 hypothetical protein ATNIH1004_002806 [Aspergillus tanneri]THC89652.1 hypothetical protein EYZ11_010897 [Aspergillus tanneri]